MNVDQALAVVARWGAPNHTRPEPGSGRAELLAAAEALAAEVRRLRPPMPLAQRGRTRDHAMRTVQLDDGTVALQPLCGGMSPAAVDPDQLDQLDTFDPEHDDACSTCVRRLPEPLRPPAPAKPKRTRQPNRLARFAVDCGPDLVALLHERTEVGAWAPPVPLSEVVSAARQYDAGGAARPADGDLGGDHGDF